MQNEAESWYDSFCCGIQKSRELGCMPFKTPLFTLGLKRAELSQLFRDNGLNGTRHLCVKISFISTLKLQTAQKIRLLTVMGNIMKVERSYPGGAQIQKFVRAASSVRKPPVSFNFKFR